MAGHWLVEPNRRLSFGNSRRERNVAGLSYQGNSFGSANIPPMDVGSRPAMPLTTTGTFFSVTYVVVKWFTHSPDMTPELLSWLSRRMAGGWCPPATTQPFSYGTLRGSRRDYQKREPTPMGRLYRQP